LATAISLVSHYMIRYALALTAIAIITAGHAHADDDWGDDDYSDDGSAWGVAGFAAIVVGVLIYSYVEDVRKRSAAKERTQANETLESRLAAVASNMTNASELLTLVQIEIEARATKAKQLAAEVEEGEQLKELTQPQKDAVASLLRGEIVRESARSKWWNVGISTAYFALGSAVTVLVTMLVHPLH
jgi:hypothetical protein